ATDGGAAASTAFGVTGRLLSGRRTGTRSLRRTRGCGSAEAVQQCVEVSPAQRGDIERAVGMGVERVFPENRQQERTDDTEDGVFHVDRPELAAFDAAAEDGPKHPEGSIDHLVEV